MRAQCTGEGEFIYGPQKSKPSNQNSLHWHRLLGVSCAGARFAPSPKNVFGLSVVLASVPSTVDVDAVEPLLLLLLPLVERCVLYASYLPKPLANPHRTAGQPMATSTVATSSSARAKLAVSIIWSGFHSTAKLFFRSVRVFRLRISVLTVFATQKSTLNHDSRRTLCECVHVRPNIVPVFWSIVYWNFQYITITVQ